MPEIEGVTKITKETLIPLSLLVLIIGGAAWLTTLNNRTLSNSRSIDTQTIGFKEFRKEINDKMSKIATKDEVQLFLSDAINRSLLDVYKEIASMKGRIDNLEKKAE